MSVYKDVTKDASVYKDTGDVVCMETNFKVKKTAEHQNLVFGWANIAKDKDGNNVFDWQGDICDPDTLEHAAYDFTMNYRATGEEHQGGIKGILIESIMFTKEKMQALGIPEGVLPEGWWVGFYVPDNEVFQKIVSGEYQMFSIQGQAKRISV